MLADQESLVVLIFRNPVTFNMILKAKVATSLSSPIVGTGGVKTLAVPAEQPTRLRNTAAGLSKPVRRNDGFKKFEEHLRVRWRDDLSLNLLLGLRDELDDMLARIRAMRQSPTRLSSVSCADIGRGADLHVCVRATILALARCRVVARDRARELEKACSAYRKTAGLDRPN